MPSLLCLLLWYGIQIDGVLFERVHRNGGTSILQIFYLDLFNPPYHIYVTCALSLMQTRARCRAIATEA